MSYKVTKNQKLNFKTELGQPRINHHSQPNTASPKLMYALWCVCVCVCVRACARVNVRVCVCVCVCVCVF